MRTARIIVCEEKQDWLLGLRWCLPEYGRLFRPVHAWCDAWGEMEAAPSSLLMWELSSVSALVPDRRLLDFHSRFPDGCQIVLQTAGDESSAWLARELGANHVLGSLHDLSAAAGLIRRQLQRVRDCRPSTVRERTWNKMPWGEHETLPTE